MKLKYAIEPVDMGDEIIAVPLGPGAQQLHGVLRLNREGREILTLLASDITQDRIVEALAGKYENTREELSAMVSRFLGTLRESGLLDE